MAGGDVPGHAHPRGNRIGREQRSFCRDGSAVHVEPGSRIDRHARADLPGVLDEDARSIRRGAPDRATPKLYECGLSVIVDVQAVARQVVRASQASMLEFEAESELVTDPDRFHVACPGHCE